MRRPQPAFSIARLCILIGVAVVGLTSAVRAAETLRVGVAAPRVFSFALLEVGVRNGIFRRHGIEVETSVFGGGPKLVQAMAGDSIDIGLDTGPDMALIAKGAPMKAVAAMAGPPLELVLLVRPDGPKTVAELKGRRIGVTAVASLTGWLVTELSRRQGWSRDGIVLTPTPSPGASWALMRTGQIDGMVYGLAPGLEAEQKGEARILVRLGEAVADFHNYVIFATDKLMAARPEAVRAFLAGWFATIAHVRADKADTVRIVKELLEVDEGAAARAYDAQLPMYSVDGKFDAKALATLARSYVEMQVLDRPPDMSTLYTERFLPILMSPDLLFAISLATKMVVSAAFVVMASIVAEKAGPLIGAMVSTLPIGSGPAYIFLSLDHDVYFLEASTVASLAVHAASGVFGMVYVMLAQRRSLVVSMAGALAAWAVCAYAIRELTWTITTAALLNAVTYAICIPLARRYLHVMMPAIRRRWFDIPLRALLVAVLVGAVVEASATLGPKLTGILAVFPIVMTSLMLIMHPRIGGPASAAIIANTMWGLVGFATSVLALNLVIVPLGAPLGLTVALAVAMAANYTIFWFRRRSHARRMAALGRPAKG